MKITDLKVNPHNPREISGEKFEKLKDSIKRNPKFLKLRPIIYDNNNVIIGGNMRYRALVALEYKTIPDEWTRRADELTKEERREFIVIDNIEAGTWDFDVLTSEYTNLELISWGFDFPVDPVDEDEEPHPISHGFKIQCDDLDQLIELCELLDIETESKSMSYGKFKMIFENRIN